MRRGLMRGLVVGSVLMGLAGAGEAQSLRERVEAARVESNRAVASQYPEEARQWQEGEEGEERGRDRQLLLDVARIQAWGLWMQGQPFRHVPAQSWQPMAPSVPFSPVSRPRTCVTQGGGSPWMTRCE